MLQGAVEDRLVVERRRWSWSRPRDVGLATVSARIGGESPQRILRKLGSSAGAGVAAGELAVQPGPGVGPVAVGGARRRRRGAAAACSTGQAGEEPELDQLGRLRGPRRPAGRGPRPGRAGRRSGRRRRARPARRGRRRGRPPPRLRPPLRRAFSTRMRRMASAAAAKKWPRPFQCWACSTSDQPQVRLVDQGGGLERLPGLLLGQPLRRRACAARRRPAAAAARRRAGRPARWRTGCG